jgi:ankyrin repeat protein
MPKPFPGLVQVDDLSTSYPYCGAIHLASLQGHLHCVRRLIAAGADPNLRDVNDDTPLMLAAERGEKDVVAVLLASGRSRV